MCRHCERIEKPEDKHLVHEFMRITADKIAAKTRHPMTADEITVSFEVRDKAHSPIGMILDAFSNY